MYIADHAFQLNTLFYSLGFGAIVAVIYDLLRLFRIGVKSKKGMFFQDFFFCVFLSFFFFCYLLVFNNGKFRFYILFAAALGFYAFYRFISPLLLPLALFVMKLLKRVILKVARIICAPFAAVAGFVHRKMRKKRNFSKKNLKLSKKALEKEK